MQTNLFSHFGLLLFMTCQHMLLVQLNTKILNSLFSPFPSLFLKRHKIKTLKEHFKCIVFLLFSFVGKEQTYSATKERLIHSPWVCLQGQWLCASESKPGTQADSLIHHNLPALSLPPLSLSPDALIALFGGSQHARHGFASRFCSSA